MTTVNPELPAISFAHSPADGSWHVFVKPCGQAPRTVAQFPTAAEAWRAVTKMRRAPSQTASQIAKTDVAAA